jgi:hypothetical protein
VRPTDPAEREPASSREDDYDGNALIQATLQGNDKPRGSTRTLWLVCVTLFLVALFPRTTNLGHLSLYGDEDLSALSATAVARGDGSLLPSGMAYRRALPLTWLNALSIRVLGEESERAFRLPSAVLGALTIPALFLLGRRWLTFGAGLTAAMMLAVSEWHLVFSRQSRMYVPLLLCIVLATWGLWSWVRTGRRWALVGGLAAAVAATFLHLLGVLVAGAPLVWLAFPGAVAVSVPAVFAVSGFIAVAGWAIGRFWVDLPYQELPIPPPLSDLGPVEPAVAAGGLGVLGIVLSIVGVLLAVQVLRKLGSPDDDRPGHRLRAGARIAFALVAGLAAGLGQVYAIAMAGAIFLILNREGIRPACSRAALPLLGLAGLLAAHLVAWSLQIGFGESVKLSAALPYPHAFTLLLQAAGPVILFGLAVLTLILRPYGEDRWGMAAAALLTLGTLAALGIVREAGPTRYLLPAYPLMILVAGAGLFAASQWVARRLSSITGLPERWVAPLGGFMAGLVVLSGALTGHGLGVTSRMVLLDHGDRVNEYVHIFPFRPDHRSVGRFVREHRRPGDIVVAEDPLVQGWYTGEIDFWFRRYGDMRRFLRVHPDGVERDIYVGSTALPNPASLDSLARSRAETVWLITSAETVGHERSYYSPDQMIWLDSLRRVRDPAFVGSDGVSAVFCLNCP